MENKRLIDADALKKSLRTDKGADAVGHSVVKLLKVDNIIDETPTVDAVEVVRGRWEDEYGGKFANPRYRCSVCKGKALYKMERDVLLSWHEVQALTPICPYCMAKLDGGKDDDT